MAGAVSHAAAAQYAQTRSIAGPAGSLAQHLAV
jgi:hypothetical protein